jgi:hypothetical protein
LCATPDDDDDDPDDDDAIVDRRWRWRRWRR